MNPRAGATDAEINRQGDALHDLTEEEIKIVEGAAGV